MRHRFSALPAAALGGLALLFTTGAGAGIHTWDVSEVFTNASGTIQFIELKDLGTGGTETGVGNGSISSDTKSHSWSHGAVTPPTNGRFYLIATPAFAALPGAPTPDVILPSTAIPFFSAAGDSVDFTTVDTCTFASAPTDGFGARDCIANVDTPSNSPTNYAGQTGSVNANAVPPGVPALSQGAQWLAIGALLAGATGFLARRRSARRA